ncbi:MAG: diguanylate cyclase [Planctomycetes bacterium]|nr:diguanylate cyclase [Planctomycetota bacterium]
MNTTIHNSPSNDAAGSPLAPAMSVAGDALPAAEPKTGQNAAHAPAVIDPAALTVLVVDDDPAALRLIARITSNAGYRVVQAKDGREAEERIHSQCPDLLVTDWDMPGLDGLQLCRNLRHAAMPFHVYVLLLTAKTGPDETVQGLEAGADDFISKPINPAVLLSRLRVGARTVTTERHLSHMARLDPLTGVMNRRTFHEQFTAEWNRAARYDCALSCAMIDLDFFKRINDTHGHAAGDAALQAIARVLESHCRASDFLARYGGEEFCAMLPETDEPGAIAWAERVRLAIAATRIPYAHQMLGITTSIGVAMRLPDTNGPDALIALADQSLSVAKELGRNRVVAFSALGDSGLDDSRRAGSRAPLNNVLARDIMQPAVYAPHQNDTVGAVADILLQLRLNAAPVLDDDGHLVGIVSETDLLAVAASTACLEMPVRECMKTDIVQYDEKTPAQDIFRFLARAAVPRVVVVRDGSPTGVISRATLLRWLRNWSEAHRPREGNSDAHSVAARRAGILKAADTASERLAALRGHLATHATDLVPCAVAEATRLESLAHDILANCRGQDTI